MISRADALAALGLAPDADAVDVRRWYIENAKLTHPDVAGEKGTGVFLTLVASRDAALAAIEREPLRCLDCDGGGKVSYSDGWQLIETVCPTCRGSGTPTVK